MEVVKSPDGKVVEPRLLRLIKPVKPEMAATVNPLNEDGSDFVESREPPGE